MLPTVTDDAVPPKPSVPGPVIVAVRTVVDVRSAAAAFFEVTTIEPA